MSSPSTRLTAIVFLLVLILAQSFGELIVARYPLPGQNDQLQLTCMSENDDGAIIWNYNPSEEENVIGVDNFSNFQPNKPRPKHILECSVWKSNECSAYWERTSTWTVANSANNPMAPALDYRWEGFEEFVFDKPKMEQKYLYVKKMDESSGVAVFSTRGLHDVYVLLCETKDPVAGQCLWIILSGWKGTKSVIMSCGKGAPAPGKFSHDKGCMEVANRTHKDEPIIDPYEWRTFRLAWDSKQRTIKVFRDYDYSPFLEKTISTWNDLSHIFVRGEISSRIRFHFYGYFLTDQENAKLSTEEFQLQDKKFCVNLLVGLCPECELSISLIDEKGRTIDTWNFFSDKISTHGLLTWQSIKLKTTWPNSEVRVVRLVIETISNTEEGKGQWAVDSFRMCDSNNRIRESTITIREKDQRPVQCQKLFHSKSTLVNAFANTPMQNTTQLQRFLSRRKEPCRSDCVNFGANSFICDQTGCTCDRGFMGRNCDQKCQSEGEFYGYNCQERCGSCKIHSCNRITGYCPVRCDTSGFLPPFCKLDFRSEKPIVTDITDTTAKVIQKVELEPGPDNFVYFYITEVESKKLFTIGRGLAMKPSMYELDIRNLTRNTKYKVKASATLHMPEGGGQANSSETTFWTTCLEKPQFEISPGQTSLTISKPEHGKICGEHTDLHYLQYDIKVWEEASGEPKCAFSTPYLPYTCSPLIAYTEYKVSISPRDTSTFSDIVRTLEPAPDQPQNQKWKNRGYGVVILKWDHPSSSATKIKKFRIYVEFLKTKLRVDPKMKIPRLIDHPIKHNDKKYSIRLHLLPSTVYRVSVTSVSEHNFNSTESKIEIQVSGSVGFESDEELQLTQSGTLIKFKAPTVVNATLDTSVSIFVKELATCAENESPKSSSLLNTREWLGAEYQEGVRSSGYVTIDTKPNQDYASNCSLNYRITYSITAVARDFYSNSSANRTWPEITPINDDDGNDLTWLITFPIIIFLLLLLLFVYRFRKSGKFLVRRNRQDIVPLSSMMTSTGNSEAPHIVYDNAGPLPNAEGSRVSIEQSPPDVVPYNPHSYSVPVEEFEEYAKEAMASGLLSSQFAVLSKGPKKECKCGKQPENLAKNRQKSVIPYDETRVVLDKIPGDPHSDYINASYIKGFRKERAYIAAQGPLPSTVNDFWRMVWQEQSHVICMLTNVVENGKTTCEQYWPEVGTEIMYGDISVSNNDHKVFADYTIRTLILHHQDTKREVTHFHYTGWPDHGVPMHTQSLVAYLKKLLATTTGSGPVVVHCSAGVGRTGIIILCSICLRQAVKEKVFNVPGVTVQMHEDRAGMVCNMQQYFLAHLVIMESIVHEQTQISCGYGLPKKITELRKQLPSHVQSLRDSVWQDRALHSLAETRSSILDDEKSGIPIVAQFHRDSTFDSESNYINAVSVDGVKMKKQYLGSHLPLPDTISEYWRLINEKKIELILILQTPEQDDPTSCDIIPSDTVFIPVPHIQVETKGGFYEEHFSTRKFLLTDSSEVKVRQRPVTVLTCTGWGREKNGRPPTPAALVSLWIASEKISRKEAPTLVLCRDGITGCGLYLALSFLLEQMAVERECDVISAVRAVRRSRTEFVQSLEQFDYLYDAAVNYFECFQTYSNFS